MFIPRFLGRFAAAMLAGAFLFGCGDDDDGPTGPNRDIIDTEWVGTVEPGDAIEIKGVIGDIIATSTSRSEVQVLIAKEGQQSDPSTVTIELVEHSGGVTICAVYPDVPGQSPNECLPGDQGTSVQDSDVEVTFTVSVPTGVVFVGRTVVGTVSATSLQSDAFGSSVIGDVSLSSMGIAEGSTVTGSVSAILGESNPGQDLEFITVTDNVTVEVPADTNAEVRASTVSGTANSDFPLTETPPSTLEGTLGSGGPTLTLTTIVGNVALKRGP